MQNNKYKIQTKLLISEQNKTNSFVNPPISRGSTVKFKSTGDMRKSMKKKHSQILTYGRFGSETTFKFEQAISEIEEGYTTVATSSGTAAIAAALISVLRNGDHILISDSVYGITKELSKNLLKRMGITTTFYNPLIGNKISELIQNNTKAIFLESPGSLTFEVQDIPAIVDVAIKNKCITIIDNTWATPLYFKPFNFGIDISIQAATKYIIGHSDAMLGAITTNKKYAKIIRQTTHSLGSCAGPEDIYLGLRGLKTLDIRLKQHKKNTFKLIEWLNKQKEVQNILYPAFPKFNGYKIWKRDFKGSTGLFGFTIKINSNRKLNKMLNNLKLFGIGYSWGGYESLILPVEPEKYRETYQWSKKQKTIRIHTGLEDIDDLIDDLKYGFKILRQK